MAELQEQIDIYDRKILFELAGVSQDVARESFRLATQKLSLKTKFIARD